MTSVRPRRIAGNIAYWDGHRERLVAAIGPDAYTFFDDFTHQNLASADAPLGWTVTLVEGGGGESTITKPDGSGGHLLLTTDANDNDGVNMQAAGEAFGFAAEQTATYFGIRLKCSEATQSDFLVGLCITDTTLLGGLTDGVYFEKLDGGTGISFVTEKDSTETQTDSLGTLAADTWVLLEFYGDGSSIRAYINGSLVATHTTNIPDNELLTPSIHFLTGDAAAETLTVDWVRAIGIGRS
jgi:prepilin-type processing-associated H-X9-DG protein